MSLVIRSLFGKQRTVLAGRVVFTEFDVFCILWCSHSYRWCLPNEGHALVSGGPGCGQIFQGGRAMALYASITFAYRRSIVLLSLVGQFTNCWKVGSVLSSGTWLKSPVMVMKSFGCRVCSFATTDIPNQQRVSPCELLSGSLCVSQSVTTEPAV